MQSERMKDELMRLDFDIHHISVMSRKNENHHALIRLVISALATTEELENLMKKDIRKKGVLLRQGGKSRLALVDERTHSVLTKICEKKRNREKVFPYSKKEMDNIVKLYSPPNRNYSVESLRSAVIKILRDCSFFEDFVPFVTGEERKDLESVEMFLADFHPMFSGMWDLEDEEVAEDFLKVYHELTGESPEKIAEKTGIDEKLIRRLLRK